MGGSRLARRWYKTQLYLKANLGGGAQVIEIWGSGEHEGLWGYSDIWTHRPGNGPGDWGGSGAPEGQWRQGGR